MILTCGRCRMNIGAFAPENLKQPLTSEMFEPIDPRAIHPFSAGQTWPHLYCPVCRMTVTLDPKDPMNCPPFVTTPDGKFDFTKAVEPEPVAELEPVEPPEIPVKLIACPYCGKEVKPRGMGAHKRFCKQRPKDFLE